MVYNNIISDHWLHKACAIRFWNTSQLDKVTMKEKQAVNQIMCMFPNIQYTLMRYKDHTSVDFFWKPHCLFFLKSWRVPGTVLLMLLNAAICYHVCHAMIGYAWTIVMSTQVPATSIVEPIIERIQQKLCLSFSNISSWIRAAWNTIVFSFLWFFFVSCLH